MDAPATHEEHDISAEERHRLMLEAVGRREYLRMCREAGLTPLFQRAVSPRPTPSDERIEQLERELEEYIRSGPRLPPLPEPLAKAFAEAALIPGNLCLFSEGIQDELTILRAIPYEQVAAARSTGPSTKAQQELEQIIDPDEDPGPEGEILEYFGDAPVLTKVWSKGPDGPVCSQYDRAKWFHFETVEVSDLRELAEQLDRIAEDKHACVIRGEVASGAPVICDNIVNRTCHKKGSQAAFFCDVPRRWLMIDVDDVSLPHGMDPLEGAAHARYVRDSFLHPEFRGRACWWQLTGSAGMKGGLIKLRLAFWLSRRLLSPAAKAWLKPSPVDLALYNPVQPHYVASPIFVGVDDPLAGRSRSGTLDGEPVVQVPDDIEFEQLDTSGIDVSQFEPLDGDYDAIFRQHIERANTDRRERKPGTSRNRTFYQLCCRIIEHGGGEGDLLALADRYFAELDDHSEMPEGVHEFRRAAQSAWGSHETVRAEFMARQQNFVQAVLDKPKGVEQRIRAELEARLPKASQDEQGVFWMKVDEIERNYVRHLETGRFIDRRNPTGKGSSTQTMRETYAPFKVKLPKKDGLPARVHNPVDAAIEIGRIPGVVGTRYDPSQPSLYETARGWILNEYIPIRDPGRLPEPKPFLEMMERFIPDRGERDYVLDVLAMKMQKPWLRMGLLAFLCEEHGSGRNTLANIISEVFNEENVEEINEDLLLGKVSQAQYQDWLKRLFVIVSETGTTADTRGRGGTRAMAANLRTLFDTTRGRRRINVKGEQNKPEGLFATGLVFSNNRAAVPIEPADRRTAVIMTAMQPKEKVREFHKWYSLPDGSGSREEAVLAIRSWLFRRDVSHFDPFAEAPHFGGRQVVLDALDTEIDRALEAVLEDADGPFFLERDLTNRVADQLNVMGVDPEAGWDRKQLPHAMQKLGVERLMTSDIGSSDRKKRAVRVQVGKDKHAVLVHRARCPGSLDTWSMDQVREAAMKNRADMGR